MITYEVIMRGPDIAAHIRFAGCRVGDRLCIEDWEGSVPPVDIPRRWLALLDGMTGIPVQFPHPGFRIQVSAWPTVPVEP